ncbi:MULTISPECIES: uracil-DNA glycosylase [Anaerofustis]|uniref:uracil-DNA glycosylase n=1 Tax=Anaerofustis TaxID=264995 RepID=UPI0014858D82|nr:MULTISPECIES: uracil-DNA glycosylase [Anaerofustis]MCO8193313.1 uracil-DNA glycosylase [Anaerofustis sp. NSJ-163]
MAIEFKNDWQDLLKDEFQKDYYKEIRKKLVYEYKHYKIYPDMFDIFNALHYTSYEDTKICIIGQDPYHGVGQAHGLSFSVRKGVAPPPSLLNIFKELEDDLGIKRPTTGCLEPWARQGVLLLNAVLTVRANHAASHRNLGWEEFTDKIISLLNEREKPLVFILWGNFAISKKKLITNPNHLILTSHHPSPLSASRGFFGSHPFSKANKFLMEHGQTPIDFSLE